MKKIRIILAMLASLMLLCGCAEQQTPYQQNDAQSYSVSVKFDAGEGFFTTNTQVIVDSFRLADLPQSGGKAQAALIPPDHPARGNDAFAPVRNGYFLAGWYAQRQETTDEAGNKCYTYAQKWDFDKDVLTLDTGAAYTAQEPVLTLYAAWVPMFQVEFVNRATGESLGSYQFDPMAGGDLRIPQWSEKTGEIDMFKFPELSGSTFDAAYYDARGTQAVTGQTLAHPGTVDDATGTARDANLQVYVDYVPGQWYHIYNVQQLQDNASLSGCYVLHADLDFDGQFWPTNLMYGKFTGTILGNGHTISNVQATQTNNSKEFAGLFGRLEDSARLENVKFRNVTFTIKAGTRKAGTSYGLLAGAISGKAAISGVEILDSRLLISSQCYFGTEDYTIGLLSGNAVPAGMDISGIACAPTGDNPEKVAITVDGNTVSVKISE